LFEFTAIFIAFVFERPMLAFTLIEAAASTIDVQAPAVLVVMPVAIKPDGFL
jgi:hypothetical protein